MEVSGYHQPRLIFFFFFFLLLGLLGEVGVPSQVGEGGALTLGEAVAEGAEEPVEGDGGLAVVALAVAVVEPVEVGAAGKEKGARGGWGLWRKLRNQDVVSARWARAEAEERTW
jgi:hypothetical protein